MQGPQDCILQHLLEPETGLGVASKNTNNVFFQRACMLSKIHKIYVKSSKTLDARASGFHFPTPSWAWSWPWGWYQKIPIMFFQRSHWTQYPKFMFRSFKTVETRASRLNFQTLPWVWRWPWGRYQKIPIMHFLRVCVFTKIPIVQLQNCGSQGPRNPFSTPSWARGWPWGW